MTVKTFPASFGQKALSVLFPQHCILCGKLVNAGDIFCSECAAGLPEEPCLRELRISGGRLFSTAAPLAYQGGYRKTLHRYKFQGRKGLALQLGWLMSGAARELPGAFDAIVYVPLSRKGLRARGYDQSRLLAQRLGKALELPVVHALEKVRDTAAQHDLDRKSRVENIRGAYACKASVAGRSLLLVDDIVTTGYTLRECAEVLYAAGAGEVFGICAADAHRVLDDGPGTARKTTRGSVGLSRRRIAVRRSKLLF